MNETNELGVLRDIVEKLAAIDPWSSDGPQCMICGGEPVLRRRDEGDRAYFYGDSEPATHHSDCPWRLADEWKRLAGGDTSHAGDT